MRFPMPALFALALLAPACAPPEPIYNEVLGLEAIPVEKAALAGRFAMKLVTATTAEFPFLGTQEMGSEIFLLVERTYLREGAYEQRVKVCGGRIRDTVAMSSEISEAGWRSVPEVLEENLEVDHERGAYAVRDHLELWALRNLPDPRETPLPADGEEAKKSPHTERIYDADEDGEPGVTMHVSGVIEGDVYFAQRRRLDLEGITLGPDRIVGLNTFSLEQVILGASNELLNESPDQTPHPDPKENWFEEVRLDDDADCDDVMEAVQSERLSRLRPF